MKIKQQQQQQQQFHTFAAIDSRIKMQVYTIHVFQRTLITLQLFLCLQ